jgi:hypothetical protein
MDTFLKKLIRFLLIITILTNVLLLCAFALLRNKFNDQYIYLSIYAFIFCAMPAILGTFFIALNRVRNQEVSGTWIYLKKEIVLSLITIGIYLIWFVTVFLFG